jgi:hypothetical protein
MTTIAKSFRPPWALTCWVDDVAVYIEIPMAPIPYIQRFALTDSGLHKALNALREIHREAPGRWEAPTQQPMITRVGKPKPTAAQLETVRAILKKHGVI